MSGSHFLPAIACTAVLLLFVGVSAVEPKSVADADPNADSGFVSMFDGESLKGWTVMPDTAAKAWKVEDGMIVGDGDKGRSYLVFDQKEIGDFEMKLSYLFPGEGNSGISIRAQAR